MIKRLDFTLLNGVFGDFHEGVDFLDVNVLDIVAPDFPCVFD